MESTAVETLMSIGIVGVALSAGIQWLQAKYGVEGSQTRAIAIVGSIVLGGFVWFFQGTPVWEAMLGVLASASTVYAMFFSGIRK